MERPVAKPIGAPSEELDTPALVVDIDALESNISTVHDNVRRAGVTLRPRLDAHLSPVIGHMQMRAGGTAGVAVSTIGQAEVFSQHGFDDILIVNLAVTRSQIARVTSLARRVSVTIGADTARNIEDLDAAARSASAEVGVAVAIRSSGHSIGAEPGKAAELASLIESAPNIRFAGLFEAPSQGLGQDGSGGDQDVSTRLEPLRMAARNCSDASIPAPMVAAGGSADYDQIATGGDVNQILAGSYALGDGALAAARPELKPAARILTTVITEQDPGLVWLDAGQKATSIDTGLPTVVGIPGASVSRMSAEHGGMILEGAPSWDVELGSKVWLVPHDIANTVNVYDFIHATRDGRLEAVWGVAARGQYS
jgi:D-serine deaminase-like pyridoxal phosphate-dependent protein